MHYLPLLCLLAASAVAQAEPATYAIDPSHTFVYFEVNHFGTPTLRGRFDRTEGQITLDKVAKRGSADISIDTGSVSTGVPALDAALKGKDGLDAATTGPAKFSAEHFVFVGDRITQVQGSLTLLGKTQPLTLDATTFNCYPSPLFRREVCGGDFDATLVRGVHFPSRVMSDLPGWFSGPTAVLGDVRLLIQIEAIKQ